MKTYSIAERDSIMERIRERCSTNSSPKAEAMGRFNDVVTIVEYPYPENARYAFFSWATADFISRRGGTFNLS